MKHFMVAIAIATLPAGAFAQPSLSSNKAGAEGDRIVKHFDFDEVRLGNLEDIPMMWEKHQAEGYPEYANAHFDPRAGYESPPSFYLELDGRSCAYHYTGLAIPVEPDSDYRIVGRIRPDHLKHARAYLSAFLLDANGHRLPATERTSRLVGGDSGSQQWQEVTIRLKGNANAAFSIGLSVWVVQPDIWWTDKKPLRHIELKDIHGGAWFDDIMVYRLPTVELSSTAADQANIYYPVETPILLVKIGDTSRHGLQATLSVRDAGGRLIRRELFGMGNQQKTAVQQVELPGLQSGTYQAQMHVQIDDGTSIDRQLTIVKLPRDYGGGIKIKHRYGVVIEPEPVKDWGVQGALVARLGIKNVKYTLPCRNLRVAHENPAGCDAFIKELVDAHVDLTGMFIESTPTATDQWAGRLLSLIDLFSKSVDTWRPYLAHQVTRYESLFRQWQIGEDGQRNVIEDARLGQVLSSIRREMAKLTASPVLVAPWSVHHEPAQPILPSNYLSITVPVDVRPAEIPDYIDDLFQGLGYQQIWILIEVPPEDRYRRLPRLADFAKRLVYAQQSSADMIFIRQPWRSRALTTKVITEPNELFLIYRTFVSQLDDATFIGKLDVQDRVSCYVFDRRGRSVLVMWDDHAPLTGREYTLHLSGADRIVDLWGNERALEQDGADRRLTLSPLPSFVHTAEAWLVQFRQGLRFEPLLLPSESTYHEQTILVSNPREEPISGSIKLRAPKGWRIRPANFGFAVQPKQTLAKKVVIQAAPREPAGYKRIEAKVTIDAARLYEFNTHLPLKLDLADMNVWADFVLEGDYLLIRHGVTNQSEAVVTFRSFADAPGRKRQNLNIINLQPGQSVVKTHLFMDATELSGEVIRVGLKQVKGPRVHDLSVRVP